MLENDLLEALIALPEQLFYNTGIATYIWVVTNRKALARRGKVQLVDATSFWVPMRKSLGDKRRLVPPERAKEILKIVSEFQEGETSKIFPTKHFGFRKITVERPLRLNFQASAGRIARLEEERGFQALATSKKNSIELFFEREVKPHVADAWIGTDKRDPKDGKVGLVGYEINFNRYFYRYTPPRSLEAIESDIRELEADIMRMLAEVTGRPPAP